MIFSLMVEVCVSSFKPSTVEYEREILPMYLINIIRSDSELHGVGTYHDRCHHTALVWNPCLGCSISSKCHWTWIDAVVTAIVALCSMRPQVHLLEQKAQHQGHQTPSQ